jgi:hypothetical protein
LLVLTYKAQILEVGPEAEVQLTMVVPLVTEYASPFIERLKVSLVFHLAGPPLELKL